MSNWKRITLDELSKLPITANVRVVVNGTAFVATHNGRFWRHDIHGLDWWVGHNAYIGTDYEAPPKPMVWETEGLAVGRNDGSPLYLPDRFDGKLVRVVVTEILEDKQQ